MRIEEIPLPPSSPLAADSTLIKILVAGLNPVDIKFAETPLVGGFLHAMPAIPGLDGVGRVVKTTDPSRQVGELVAFRVDSLQTIGVLAEYVVVQREACAAVPENVSLKQAAVVGTCGLTACQALAFLTSTGAQEQGRQPRVFINGGSGGTGTFQIQVAKAMGYYVVTSCSTPNVELCKELGADEVIDYRLGPAGEKLVQMVRRDKDLAFDLAVDNVDRPWRLYKAADEYLRPEGTYLQVGGDISLQSIKEWMYIRLWPTLLGGAKRKWTFLLMKSCREDFERVLGWMAEGKVEIPIDDEFSFEQVPSAYVKLKGGRTKGKIVVRVCED